MSALAAAAALPAPHPGLRACVAVPARDEEERIGACLAALAAQDEVDPLAYEILLVLDACRDATAARARATAARHPALRMHVLPGAGAGPGPARRLAMDLACARLLAVGRPDGLIACTDADSRVAPDWLAAQLRAVARGARAVGGRIELDPADAAVLPAAVLSARRREAGVRLAAVRATDPAAAHHQFSGASMALTAEAYRAVGGLEPLPALEDEGLERRLRANGVAIARRADVRVTTAARAGGRAARGLGHDLRVQGWLARQREADVRPRPLPVGAVVRVDPRPGEGRAAALVRVLATTEAEVVLMGRVADGPVLAGALLADSGLLVAKGDPGGGGDDPITALLVRPLLNLRAAELVGIADPAGPRWAARAHWLRNLAVPAGDAVDLAVLLDAWRTGGLEAVAQRRVAGGPRGADAPERDRTAAYALLAAAERRLPPFAVAAAACAVGAAAGRLTVARADVGELGPARRA